ncbi:B3 domain-containing protein Os06g0194400-like [Hordeum vulgare subsp. vulgare]|uniref:B3 domain-containing protein Os06g0194400-like n=1 Tax=Hordeum vulgare subsp. vulgare TaxID=112509 RepID=UPI001D1A4898|nr:B3 domain-containing protein Os06g0194400-like [Hordeum vulgare subsp. vulgare]
MAYEEQRRRQMEEDNRKLEELHLHQLSAAGPKPSPVRSEAKSVKRVRVRRDAQVRQSGRVASLPKQPKYRYEDDCPTTLVEKKIRRRGSSMRSDLINRVYATDEARRHANSMAEELLGKLVRGGIGNPSFIKPMKQSHVTGGFWLGLPAQFCQKYLLGSDHTITLEDEEGEEYETRYLALKTGLSAGWRKFALEHNLVDGDCLVFEWVIWNKFYVYIMRQSSYYK